MASIETMMRGRMRLRALRWMLPLGLALLAAMIFSLAYIFTGKCLY
jgi:hypothetical protein